MVTAGVGLRAHPRKKAVVTTTAARRTFAAAVLPADAMRFKKTNVYHTGRRVVRFVSWLSKCQSAQWALPIIGAKNGAQQAGAVLSWIVERGAVLWCGAMAMAHHTHHGQVRACVMAHTTHTPSYTPHWGWGGDQ